MDSEAQDSHYEFDNNSYRMLSKGNEPHGNLDKQLQRRTDRDQTGNLDISDKLGMTSQHLLAHFESPSNQQLIIRKSTNRSEFKGHGSTASQFKGIQAGGHPNNAPKIASLNNSFRHSKTEDLRVKGLETKIDLDRIKDEDEINLDKQTTNKRGQNEDEEDGEPKYDLEQVSNNVLKVMKQRSLFGATDPLSQPEEDDIMDLKLDFNEEPVTLGSMDEQVQVEKRKVEFFIVKHSGKFRIRWDLFVITLVIYNAIQIPLEMAFQERFSTSNLDIFGHVVDICFILDLLFNFRTTFINEKTGLEVIEGKIIAKTYVMQWRFWFDFLSIIPFELLYNWFSPEATEGAQANTTTFKILNLLKLIRLLRLGRIITYLKFKQNVKIGFRMVYLLFFLLLLVHWIACVWYILIEDSTWMPPMDANYGETLFYESSMGEQYPVVFYYAILLLVGSEILPMNTNQTIVASLVVIMGQITTAFIFGNMAALMAAMNQKDSQFQEQFETISNLMRAIQLPVPVQEEVESYLLHIQQIPDMQQDMQIFLNLLSPSLRSSILFHIYKTVIKKIPIFDQCSNIELRFIVNKMKTIIFLPDDEIIRQGDNGNKLYFVSRGKVDVWIGPDEAQDNVFDIQDAQSPLIKQKSSSSFKGDGSVSNGQSVTESGKNSNKLVQSLGEGHYFGEISLITHLKRTATIKAKDFTTLAYMVKRHFLASREEFPQIFQNFKKCIKDRYDDENFRFRKNMIKNVPYFRNLSDLVVQELIYLLKPIRYDPGMLVVKRGDSTDKIFFLKAGEIDVEVPLRQDKMLFDKLNTGSCFCIFSAFNEDRKQKFDFRTKTLCIVETISAEDIQQLQKEQLELSDELKTLRCQIEMNEKSDFDFFRYVKVAKNGAHSEEKKSLIRKKFRMAISKFFAKLKASRMIVNFIGGAGSGQSTDEARNAVFDQFMDKEAGG